MVGGLLLNAVRYDETVLICLSINMNYRFFQLLFPFPQNQREAKSCFSHSCTYISYALEQGMIDIILAQSSGVQPVCLVIFTFQLVDLSPAICLQTHDPLMWKSFLWISPARIFFSSLARFSIMHSCKVSMFINSKYAKVLHILLIHS